MVSLEILRISRLAEAKNVKNWFSTSAVALKHKQFKKTSVRPVRRKLDLTEEELYEKFQDEREIKVVGGKGGDGVVSFLKAWCLPEGGPDGGDGGKGGDVIFKADINTKTLRKIPTVCQAKNGKNGGTTNKFGKNGQDLVVNVPMGTLFRLKDEEKDLMDLANEESEFVAAYGGLGGKGNKFFTTSTNPVAEESTDGEMGEEKRFIVSLKTVAHCGLVGMPNAGKSTLLRSLTNATPLIGDYPYTTLVPHLGVLKYMDYTQIVIADIPGIVKDAHKNQGEGIQFLKHIQRCRFLIILIDLSSKDPFEQYNIILRELLHFKESLVEIPRLVVCNKIDLEENFDKYFKFCEQIEKYKIDENIIHLSGLDHTNTEELINQIRIFYDMDLDSEDSLKW